MKKSNVSLIIPLYAFTCIFVLVPILYVLYLSFMSRAEVWGVVNTWTLDNYKKILDPLYLSNLKESLQLAVVTTICIMFLGYPYGYFMARLGTKWKKRLLLLIMIPFWTSSLIRLNGWVIVFRSNGTLDQILMKIGLIEKPLKLLYSYPAVLVGMIYALFPFMILAVYSSVEKMDWSVVEAARDLGASPFKTFWTVILPMTAPGLLSGIVLTFVPSMGLFYIADILGGNKIVLIGSVIQEQLTKGRNLPFAAALAVILMIMTSLMLGIYRKIANTGEVEGII